MRRGGTAHGAYAPVFGKKLGTININGDFRGICDKKVKIIQILQNKLGRNWGNSASWGEVGKILGRFWEKVGNTSFVL